MNDRISMSFTSLQPLACKGTHFLKSPWKRSQYLKMRLCTAAILQHEWDYVLLGCKTRKTWSEAGLLQVGLILSSSWQSLAVWPASNFVIHRRSQISFSSLCHTHTPSPVCLCAEGVAKPQIIRAGACFFIVPLRKSRLLMGVWVSVCRLVKDCCGCR